MTEKTRKDVDVKTSYVELRLKEFRAGIMERRRQPNNANFELEVKTGAIKKTWQGR
jgi:hypothetical protein